jgi:hypothetical protein
MVTWCMKFYLVKKNDIDLAIYKSIESGLITINQKSWFTKQSRIS